VRSRARTIRAEADFGEIISSKEWFYSTKMVAEPENMGRFLSSISKATNIRIGQRRHGIWLRQGMHWTNQNIQWGGDTLFLLFEVNCFVFCYSYVESNVLLCFLPICFSVSLLLNVQLFCLSVFPSLLFDCYSVFLLLFCLCLCLFLRFLSGCFFASFASQLCEFLRFHCISCFSFPICRLLLAFLCLCFFCFLSCLAAFRWVFLTVDFMCASVSYIAAGNLNILCLEEPPKTPQRHPQKP